MKIPKGLKIKQIRAGTGRVAEPGKFALIHYDCYLPRGEKCESSRDRGFPVQLRVGERLTYPALAYAVPGMAVGEIRMVKVSPNLTYSERKQNPDLPPDVALRYEIELISLNDEWDNGIYRASDEVSLS
jgi:FKBP-type peptidyl-prolyl cis-trans isomerase